VANKNTEVLTDRMPPAVIAGAYQTGVLGVRTLKRHGIKALCFDCNDQMPGFRSVYGPARLCPNPDTSPQEWLDFMISLAGELGTRAVLIASADIFVTAIANHRRVLSDYFLLSPGIHLQGQLAQKHTQYNIALENNMPMPTTGMINTLEELLEFSKELSYPCLIKPQHFREWEQFPNGHPLSYKKIAIVNTEQELIENYKLACKANPQVIIQDIIQGPDTEKRVYLAYYDKQGNRIANALFKELRCVPLGFGPASVSEPVEDTEADKVCDAFLKKIGYKGICEIEVKRDTKDGKVKLIEANPRLSGGGDAAPYAGVDLCWIHYLEMIGQPVEKVTPSRKDFRHVVLREEGRAIPAYMRAGLLTWKELLNSYKRPIFFFDFDRHDWRYSLETLLITLKLIIMGFLSGK
jgi:D-aspartate ligase